MIYAILASIGALLAWLYRLVQQNGDLKQKAAQEAAKKAITEWSDQVVKLEGKINEDTRDYENAKEEFNNHAGAKPIPPGDTK